MSSSTPNRRKVPTYHIPQEIKTLAAEGVARVLENMGLRPGMRRDLLSKMGNGYNTATAYNKHFRGLRFFCSLIGSLVIPF